MVRETMPLINMPMVEALTVMGHANPFFEKAGMKPYKAPPSAQTIRIAEALSLVGIEDELYIDAEATHKHIEDLPSNKKLFIEREMERFLQSYRKQRHMPDRLERTRFLLSKLTDRPIYYLWLNKLLVG
jgi:hypothetical protein